MNTSWLSDCRSFQRTDPITKTPSASAEPWAKAPEIKECRNRQLKLTAIENPKSNLEFYRR
jgi:hypothetical protein